MENKHIDSCPSQTIDGAVAVTNIIIARGVDIKQIGQIGGGKNKRTGLIDIAMVQSMGTK